MNKFLIGAKPNPYFGRENTTNDNKRKFITRQENLARVSYSVYLKRHDELIKRSKSIKGGNCE